MMEEGFVQSPQSSYNEVSEDEESASESSDTEMGGYGGERQRFQVNRENLHD